MSRHRLVDGLNVDKWAERKRYFSYGKEHKQGYGYRVC